MKDKLLKTFKDVAFLSTQKAVDIIKGMRGKANGFASLNSEGKIPMSELDIEPSDIGASPTSHTHNYAGSSSAGGSATSAVKLDSSAGDSNTPVYFSNGKPVACISLDLNTTGSASTLDGLTSTVSELNYVSGVTSSIQTQLDGKADFKCKYKITENTGSEQYYKLLTISPTANYASSNYEFHIASRTDRISKVTVYVNSSNDKYLNGKIYYEGNTFPSSYIRGYLYKDTENATSYFEIWVKLSAWNELMFYEKTYQPRSISITWNITKGDSFPSDATTTVTPTATPWYGNAATATKLGTSTVGSVTQPIYLNSGTPTKITYTLGKSVPSDAVFTDTTDLSSMTGTLPASKGGTGKTSLLTSANALINALESGNSSPTDASCFVAQGTGDYSNNYYRKPMSYLWNYIKGKTDSIYATLTHSHVISDVIDLQTALDGKASSSHTHSSYVNQNAFSTVKVGSTSVSADTATDTLTLTAGNNVTITPDATNDKITISSSHPTIQKSTDTTSSTSPSAGGTFTTVDSVTRDTNGHVTKVNTKTITLPSTTIATDSELSETSDKPIQNKTVTNKFKEYLPLSGGVIDDISYGATFNTNIYGDFDIVAGNNGSLKKMKILADGIEFYADTQGFSFNTSITSNTMTTNEIVGNNISQPALIDEKIEYLNISTYTNISGHLCVSYLRPSDAIKTSGWGNEGYIIYDNNAFKPAASGQFTLGDSICKWGQIFSTNATISTSDKNEKDNIENLNSKKWMEFFMKLQPKSFTFINGTSGRTHVGFISQDVEEAMSECGLTSLDFAGFCKDQKMNVREEVQEAQIVHVEEPVFDENGEPVYTYSLRYEEFIALNTMMIQNLYSAIEELKNDKINLKERLDKIEEKLSIL